MAIMENANWYKAACRDAIFRFWPTYFESAFQMQPDVMLHAKLETENCQNLRKLNCIGS